MTSTDLIMKSIENLILYGIDLEINPEDSNEYLYQMQNYYNEQTEDMIATLNDEIMLIDDLDGAAICSIYIDSGILRIMPSGNKTCFDAIVLMLEFVSSSTELFMKEDTEQQEDSDDDFDWI
jgi:hypothetical protein